MDDIGGSFLSVGVHVFHPELLGQQHVNLNGNQRVLFAVDVFVLDVQLGAVKGGLVHPYLVLHPQIVQNLAHDPLGFLPLLRGALILVVGVGGVPLGEAEGTFVQQAHRAQAVFGQVQTALELLFQLVRAEDQVALGDGELAHPNQAVHLAGVLVAEQGGGLPQAHGQVPVAAAPVQEHLVLEGAGHGPQGEALLGLVHGVAQDEHAVQVMIPVARDLVQLPLGHIGRLSQQITPLALLVLHPALEGLDRPGALGQDDGQALTDHVHGGEILQLTAQLIVIPPLGVLHLG